MDKELIEARLVKARALVAALSSDDRAQLPSGPARTAYTREFKRAILNLNKLQKELKNPTYSKIEPLATALHKVGSLLKWPDGQARCVVFGLSNLPFYNKALDAPSRARIAFLRKQKYLCEICARVVGKRSNPTTECRISEYLPA